MILKTKSILGLLILNSMNIAYLEIMTWVGSSVVWYAKHYYGMIRFGDERVDVECKLMKEEVDKLNVDSREDFFLGSKYKVGEMTTRFSDKKKLIKEAIKLFKKDSHGYDALLEGRQGVCDPLKILVGPKDIMKKANLLWELFEERGGWGCPEDEESKVRIITDKWDEIVGKFWERD